MNSRIAILLLLACCAFPAPGAQIEFVVIGQPSTNAPVENLATALQLASHDALVFRNGDLLYGLLDQVSSTNQLDWIRSDILDPLTFHLPEIASVHFRDQRRDPSYSTNRCEVHLANLDVLTGDLLSYDGQTLLLRTWYAGDLRIPRERATLLIPVAPPPPLLFSGPAGLEGWVIGQVANPGDEGGQWRYKTGAFYATRAASIGRNVQLPSVATIEFDLDWRGTLNLAVALYTSYFQPIKLLTKETEPPFGGFYSLQINSHSLNLIGVKQVEPLRYLGQAIAPGLAQQTSARCRIHVSKPKQTISLVVDGRLVKQWTDPEPFAGTGTGFKFVHQGQGAVRLSNISVSEWDGQFDERPALSPSRLQDIAKLRNEDRVGGTLLRVENGQAHFDLGARSLEFPIARTKYVEFAARPANQIAFAPPAAQAFLRDGGRLTISIEHWQTNRARVTSPNFGTTQLDTAAVSAIQFLSSGSAASSAH